MNESFGIDWLALREPFDHAARIAGSMLVPSAPSDGRALQILDLGCGTGSNLRAVALRLRGRQRWRMVDHDPALLAEMPVVLERWATAEGLRASRSAQGLLVIEGGDGLRIEIEPRRVDMARDFDGISFAGVDLVTASALLDLASAGWIEALVDRCRAANADVAWALSVDGRLAWTPPHPDDPWMLAQFHSHQQRDKGFGAALGQGAAAHAIDALQRSGYRVSRSRADWQVDARRGSADQAMLRAMVDGMAHAVAEQASTAAPRIEQWRSARLAGVPSTRLCVGHVDVWGRIDGA